LTKAILAVVDQQMRDNTQPEPHRTFERLVGQGHAPEDVHRLIGNVVTQEIFAVMQRGEAYNQQRYIGALHALPDNAI
jgi:hypothetical protein